jgi:FMN-dependent NADH-azoreductase
MKNVLQLNSSIYGDGGASTRLADEVVSQLRPTQLVVRDLVRDPVPHLTEQRFRAFGVEPSLRSAEDRAAVAYSDALIAELSAADTVVLGLPMYNFGIPSQLKAYFDHVARAGVTFRYTSNGPEGLLKNKNAIVAATRGGKYAGTGLDNQTSYVRQFLGFLGISDVRFVYAEGLALGDIARQQAVNAARRTIAMLGDDNERRRSA